jgi:hypothetical protein
MIAKQIVELAKAGERNPELLALSVSSRIGLMLFLPQASAIRLSKISR